MIYQEFWKERIALPTYRVVDAARYAGTTAQTIGNWQRLVSGASAIGHRDQRQHLSYLQLIEVGVVAAMRKGGVPLNAVRSARDYLAKEMNAEFPFAQYEFKTDGKSLILDSEAVDKSVKDKLIVVSESGQYAWKEILQSLLRAFEYPSDGNGPVVKWRVAGAEEPIIIDPRISFGSPVVRGIPTWMLKERWESGEGLRDIAEDYGLEPSDVMAALRFEKTDIDIERPNQWVH
ncbi:DUF433 domain-containing protein [Rhizobium sp. TRM95111]|uniref:DUF433 domain-containing protein n=1 Tax=Rhizobium alarense TaxID=2846851 RepID=UPI001F222BF0|nr:DUF433 domain-containing protein [Rhizobium alarense]MCF3638613.1 DUF433 domain-containing protein [Rhizobium alarense]